MKYDPQEDRIRLSLQIASGSECAYWVTRRQWLALIHNLGSHTAAKSIQKNKAKQLEGGEIPSAGDEPRIAKSSPDGSSVSPLKAIKLRQTPHCLKLILLATEGHVTVDLPYETLTQFKEMLSQQAEAGGWDCDAALQRLALGKRIGLGPKLQRYLH